MICLFLKKQLLMHNNDGVRYHLRMGQLPKFIYHSQAVEDMERCTLVNPLQEGREKKGSGRLAPNR